MVLQKRFDYGFHGYQFPPTPRAARSARRRGSFKRRYEDTQVCAFDLLAIVAGNLLLEKEPTPSSDNSSANNEKCEVINNNVKQGVQDGATLLKVEAYDRESPSRSLLYSNVVTQVHDQNLSPKESVCSHDDLNLGLASAITSELEERSDAVTLACGSIKNESGTFACKVEAVPSRCREAGESNPGTKIKGERKEVHPNSPVANICRLGDPSVGNRKPPASVSSDTGPKVLLYGEQVSRDSYTLNRDHVDIGSRDDDENSSGYTYPKTIKKYYRLAPCIGDRRIRKILASRPCKAAPKLKDSLCDTDELKPAFHKRNNHYKIQRSDKIYPLKKRKYFQYSSPSNSDAALSSDSVAESHRKGGDGDPSGCCQKMRGGTGASSSITAENSSLQRQDSHVTLRIKSFRVPELFVDVPESATVSSLKRTVMESVTAILRGGFRIGMFLQGKKVRDDNKTLLQAGLSHNHQFNGVGFSLEPNPSQGTDSLCNGGSPFLPACEASQPLSRCPASPSVVHQGTFVTPPESHVNHVSNIVESDHDSAPSPVDMLIDKPAANSKALVAVPALNVEALAVVPVQRKFKRSEIVQRRIRRPFSVVEVEALVKAVEKLGTGRWRDVKLRAFDNAKHRTYVDLKDKWKTLVHTAKISPQQRRGEPVPQELLDRVLTAHAYWSQQQSKQIHVKHQQPETSLFL